MPVDPDLIRPRLSEALGGSFQLGELLGVGGFAAVFRARDPFLQRDVAIKVIDPSLGLTSELQEQFLSEARIVAGVEHPHIVPLYAAESKNGLLYLVMRLLPGQSLADRIERHGALTPTDAARLAHEIAQALAAAHARGVVHRDIKPDNILLDSAGHATVTDFGISLVAQRAKPDVLGMTVGTPRYMSPEQALGGDVDGRADVYSLGVVLYEMLTGAVPFEGRTVTELIAKQIAAPPPKVSAAKPETPASLVALVDKLLAKQASERPTAAEAAAWLAAARTPDAMLTPRQVRVKKWRRRLVLVGVAGVSAGLVLWAAIAAISGLARLFFAEPGAPAVLSLHAPGIPDSLVLPALADGSLHMGEHVHYAFIPAGHTSADVTLWTDSAIVRRSPQGARRIVIDDPNFFLKARRGEPTRAYFTMRHKGAAADSIYDDLSPQQVTTLLAAMKVRDSVVRKERERP